MRRKVVLYNPRSVFFTLPLGLLAVGSALDPREYEVRILDGRLEEDSLKTVLAQVDDALCLGISVLTGDPIHDALRVSRAVKARRPGLPVVWGGWHPSLFPEGTLEEKSIDATVQGQGEETFRELVARLAAGQSLEGLRGAASREDGRIKVSPSRPLTEMNAHPAHDYRLIPTERYFVRKGQRQLDYVSSIGCPFRCAFCADPFVYQRRWTGLAPERVGEEIDILWRRYRFADLAFQDETFFTHPDRVVAIAQEFLRRDLHFTWTGTLRADQARRLTDEALALCVRSGLRQVMVGVESGSQPMLDSMTKDITVEQVVECAERCVRHGVGAIFPFILGFPGESSENESATLDLVKRLRAMSPRFETPIFYFKPYPGSRITEKAVEEGFRLPDSLEGWAGFDFVGGPGPWVRPEQYRRIERFKFYNRFAWGPETWQRWPLQKIARLRCRRDFYAVPWEKALVERLKPLPRLS